MYMHFSFFSFENKLFGIHQTPFLPVEALEFSELKTPLVYTFFPATTLRKEFAQNIFTQRTAVVHSKNRLDSKSLGYADRLFLVNCFVCVCYF